MEAGEFDDYYLCQAGGSLSTYRKAYSRTQVGGGILSSLARRYAVPTLKWIGRAALKKGRQYAPKLKEAALRKLSEKGDELIDKVSNKVERKIDQLGTGKGRRKKSTAIKAKPKKSSRKGRKRKKIEEEAKLPTSTDIFG